MRSATGWTTIGLALLMCAPASGGSMARAGGSAAVPSESFDEKISVMEVVVPVRVTAGRLPILGLGPEDFELYDRGERQEIVSFEVVDLSEKGPQVLSGSRSQATEPVVGRSLLLLFDLTFSNHFSVLRALEGAREMVAGQLHPADRAAVAYFSAFHGINFIVGFTDEQRQLDVALDVVEGVLARKPARVRERQAALGRLQENDSAGDMVFDGTVFDGTVFDGTALDDTALDDTAFDDTAFDDTAFDDTAFGNSVFSSLGRSVIREGRRRPSETRLGPAGGLGSPLPDEPLDFDKQAAQTVMVSYVRELSRALTEAVELLDRLGGMRHVVLFSEGFANLSPLSSVGTQILADLEPMRQAFLRTGWMLQSIDLKGVPVSYAKFNNNALFYLANETGGELFENYNQFEQATARFLERSSVTYMITYRARDVEVDGRFHRIEVKLAKRGDGVRLRHRPGYYAPKPSPEI